MQRAIRGKRGLVMLGLEKRLPLITHLLIPLYPAAALFLLLCLHTTLSCK